MINSFVLAISFFFLLNYLQSLLKLLPLPKLVSWISSQHNKVFSLCKCLDSWSLLCCRLHMNVILLYVILYLDSWSLLCCRLHMNVILLHNNVTNLQLKNLSHFHFNFSVVTDEGHYRPAAVIRRGLEVHILMLFFIFYILLYTFYILQFFIYLYYSIFYIATFILYTNTIFYILLYYIILILFLYTYQLTVKWGWYQCYQQQ